MRDDGFTRMGIANCSQYFLIVPNPHSTNDAYFNGVDYHTFLRIWQIKLFSMHAFF